MIQIKYMATATDRQFFVCAVMGSHKPYHIDYIIWTISYWPYHIDPWIPDSDHDLSIDESLLFFRFKVNHESDNWCILNSFYDATLNFWLCEKPQIIPTLGEFWVTSWMFHQVNFFSPYNNKILIFSYFKRVWMNFVWSDWYEVTFLVTLV